MFIFFHDKHFLSYQPFYFDKGYTLREYGVLSGLYFPVFGLNTGKYGPEETPYSNTFHAVITSVIQLSDAH